MSALIRWCHWHGIATLPCCYIMLVTRYWFLSDDILFACCIILRLTLHPAVQSILTFRKNKSFRPRERSKKGLKNLQTVKTLAGRTQSYGSSNQQLGKARKQPLTVTAQFQQSLHSLMDTLNQANPFFIRCIKSNSDKVNFMKFIITSVRNIQQIEYHNRENLERYEPNKNGRGGGQRSTYLRQAIGVVGPEGEHRKT